MYAIAKVALFDQPDREINAEILDVSGAGLRVWTEEAFQEDQIITVETDQHFILADVRNCLARGRRFAIGVERIHAVAKVALPQTTSKLERNQALIADFHGRLRDELENPSDQIAPRPRGAAARFRERLAAPAPPAEDSVLPPVPAPQPEAASPPLDPPPAEPPVVTPEPLNVVAVGGDPLSVAARSKPAEPVAAGSEHTEIDPVRAATQRSNAMPSNMVEPPSPASLARSRVVAVLVASGFTILAIGILLFGPFAKRGPLSTSVAANAPSAPIVGTESVVPKVPPAPAKSADAPVALPVPVAGKSHATIQTSDRSWVTACVDGKMVFSKLFTAGDHDSIEFTSRAVVRMGNAGPVEIQLDGKAVGSLGQPGQVKVFELTPGAWHFLAGGEPSDCTVAR